MTNKNTFTRLFADEINCWNGAKKWEDYKAAVVWKTVFNLLNICYFWYFVLLYPQNCCSVMRWCSPPPMIHDVTLMCSVWVVLCRHKADGQIDVQIADKMDGWWWFRDGWCIVSYMADTQQVELCSRACSRAQSSESQCPLSETDLWGCTLRIQGCIFSVQRSHRSSSDRRLLTVIGCYLGGCQLGRQFSTLYASSVCLECQRSGALNVWSVLTGRLGRRVIWEEDKKRRCVSGCVWEYYVRQYLCLCVQS